MSPGNQTTTGTQAAHAWEPDLIFKTISQPVRRKLLLAIARQGAQAPSELQAYAERTFDLTVKRLALLRGDGLLVMKADRQDKRRKLYSLAPTVLVAITEEGTWLDFGFLKVRVNGPVGKGGGAADAGGVQWAQDVIYAVLAEPSRRKLLSALARTPKQTGAQLFGKKRWELEPTLQQLAVLRKAGLIVRTANENDGRQPLYSLAPAVLARLEEDGVIFDFGFCVVKL